MTETAVEDRQKKSLRNFAYGILAQSVTLLLNFAVRSVFIYTLDKVYLGVNGLFTDILTVLSLAELGFGSAIIYAMYKPLADKDTNKLQAIINLYRKVYWCIGLIVAVLGVAVIPFFPYIIKDCPPIPHLTFIYLLFLLNSVSSYFFAYKRSVLDADQKSYVCYKYRLCFCVLRSIAQMACLYLLQSFILFLAIQVAATILENIAITLYVNRHYPFLATRNKQKLDKSEISVIRKNVYALMLSRVARVIYNGSVNIVISATVGIICVGLYSNYVLIVGAILMILNQVTEAIRAGVGNYIATQPKEQHILLFNKIDFCNFVLYGFSAIMLFVLINPFIALWAGKDYMLSDACAMVIAINFFIQGILDSLWLFRSTLGLFTQGKYRPVFSAGLNIALSILLGRYFGIVGVLLGNTFARILVNLWYDPYIIFKFGFNAKPWRYFARYALRILFIAATALSLYYLRILMFALDIPQIAQFSSTLVIAMILSVTAFYFTFRDSDSGRYLLSIMRDKTRAVFHKTR